MAVVLGLTVAGMAQEREPLTLPLAVEVALRSHPLVRAGGAGQELAQAQVREAARAGALH